MRTVQSRIMFSAHALSPCGLPPTFSLVIGQHTRVTPTDNKARRYISTGAYSYSCRVEGNEAEEKVETGGHPINRPLSRATSEVVPSRFLDSYWFVIVGVSLPARGPFAPGQRSGR